MKPDSPVPNLKRNINEKILLCCNGGSIKKALKDGYADGHEKGHEEGLKKGLEQGLKEGQLLMAKRLKELGISNDEIIKATGLSEVELHQI